jgi:terminal uridylyltransferase
MNEQYQCEKFEIIEKIAKSFKNNSYYSRVLPILSARVPIVKLYIPSHKIEGDVSLENCLALENTRMLASYCNIDDRVRPLGYAIKSFAKTCDMCDAASGSLSSYAYVIMLIHYLQQLRPPVLPVLQKLPYGGTNKGPIIDGWNCYFFKPSCIQQLYDVWRPIAKNMCSISQLWLGFLRYYAKDFDWGHQVVTMRQLEPLTKFEKWWSSKPIAIEDPFNLDHNLGQAVSAKMRTYILMRFQKAYLYHCKHKNWTDIDELMDVNVLCGDFKPPKFILCDKCGKRGHRSGECPSEIDDLF